MIMLMCLTTCYFNLNKELSFQSNTIHSCHSRILGAISKHLASAEIQTSLEFMLLTLVVERDPRSHESKVAYYPGRRAQAANSQH